MDAVNDCEGGWKMLGLFPLRSSHVFNSCQNIIICVEYFCMMNYVHLEWKASLLKSLLSREHWWASCLYQLLLLYITYYTHVNDLQLFGTLRLLPALCITELFEVSSVLWMITLWLTAAVLIKADMRTQMWGLYFCSGIPIVRRRVGVYLESCGHICSMSRATVSLLVLIHFSRCFRHLRSCWSCIYVCDSNTIWLTFFKCHMDADLHQMSPYNFGCSSSQGSVGKSWAAPLMQKPFPTSMRFWRSNGVVLKALVNFIDNVFAVSKH
jgi:hypothetical protein